MPDLQFFDSQECEWADMTINIGGSPLTKITAVKYKSSTDKKLIYAQGDKPISIQSGNRAYEGTITVLKGAVDDMNTAAVLAGGKDILDLEFDIVIVYASKGTRPLHTDTLVRCQVKDFEKTWKQGEGKMEVAINILFLDVISA